MTKITLKKVLTISIIIALALLIIPNSGVVADTDSTVISKNNAKVEYDYYNERHLNISSGGNSVNLTLPKTIDDEQKVNVSLYGATNVRFAIRNYSDEAPIGDRTLFFNKTITKTEDFKIEMDETGRMCANLSSDQGYINVTLTVSAIYGAISEVVDMLIYIIPTIIVIAIISLVVGLFKFGGGGW